MVCRTKVQDLTWAVRVEGEDWIDASIKNTVGTDMDASCLKCENCNIR